MSWFFYNGQVCRMTSRTSLLLIIIIHIYSKLFKVTLSQTESWLNINCIIPKLFRNDSAKKIKAKARCFDQKLDFLLRSFHPMTGCPKLCFCLHFKRRSFPTGYPKIGLMRTVSPENKYWFNCLHIFQILEMDERQRQVQSAHLTQTSSGSGWRSLQASVWLVFNEPFYSKASKVSCWWWWWRWWWWCRR